MKDVWLAKPLYVPSESVFLAIDLDERASWTPSSYQLLCLVASFESEMGTWRFAVKTVAFRSLSPVAASLDEAVMAPVLFRLLTRRPDSSSELEKSLSLSLFAGGGVAGRFLMLAFPLPPRFLKSATGAASGDAAVVSESMLMNGAVVCSASFVRNSKEFADESQSVCFIRIYGYSCRGFDGESSE